MHKWPQFSLTLMWSDVYTKYQTLSMFFFLYVLFFHMDKFDYNSSVSFCMHTLKKERLPRNREWFALKRENKHKRDLQPHRQAQQVIERAVSLQESHVDSDLDKEEISADGWETNSKTPQREQHWCVATIAAVIVNTIAQSRLASVSSSTCTLAVHLLLPWNQR